MPSIELVCIKQEIPTDFSGFPFTLIGEDRLFSHRVPSPLFQSDFDRLQGCIYHLGGPKTLDNSNRGYFTAYDLLSEVCRSQENSVFLEFKKDFLPFLKNIIQTLMKDSPVGIVLFTSDYQFGPKKPQRYGAVSYKNFWDLHETHKLRFNTSYEISNKIKKSGVRHKNGKN